MRIGFGSEGIRFDREHKTVYKHRISQKGTPPTLPLNTTRAPIFSFGTWRPWRGERSYRSQSKRRTYCYPPIPEMRYQLLLLSTVTALVTCRDVPMQKAIPPLMDPIPYVSNTHALACDTCPDSFQGAPPRNRLSLVAPCSSHQLLASCHVMSRRPAPMLIAIGGCAHSWKRKSDSLPYLGTHQFTRLATLFPS